MTDHSVGSMEPSIKPNIAIQEAGPSQNSVTIDQCPTVKGSSSDPQRISHVHPSQRGYNESNSFAHKKDEFSTHRVTELLDVMRNKDSGDSRCDESDAEEEPSHSFDQIENDFKSDSCIPHDCDGKQDVDVHDSSEKQGASSLRVKTECREDCSYSVYNEQTEEEATTHVGERDLITSINPLNTNSSDITENDDSLIHLSKKEEIGLLTHPVGNDLDARDCKDVPSYAIQKTVICCKNEPSEVGELTEAVNHVDSPTCRHMPHLEGRKRCMTFSPSGSESVPTNRSLPQSPSHGSSDPSQSLTLEGMEQPSTCDSWTNKASHGAGKQGSSVSTFVYGICNMPSFKTKKKKCHAKQVDQSTSISQTVQELASRRRKTSPLSMFPNVNNGRVTPRTSKETPVLHSDHGRYISRGFEPSQSSTSKKHQCQGELNSGFHDTDDMQLSESSHLQEQALDLSRCGSKKTEAADGSSPEREHISYIAEFKEDTKHESEPSGASQRGFLSITGLIQKHRTPMMKRYWMKEKDPGEPPAAERCRADGSHLAKHLITSHDQVIHGLSQVDEHCVGGSGNDSAGSTSTHLRPLADSEEETKVSIEADDPMVLREEKSRAEHDKPFKCKICGKGFRHSQGRTAHVKIHSDERPFACQHCDQRFRVKQNLITHVRTHTGEKPHSCQICGRGFGQQSTLVRHLRSHTGERPYTCKYCERTFSQRHVMMNHIRIHTGEKPYSCEVCGKGFKEQHNLVRHVRTHTGEKPYTCSECGNKFTQKNHLIRHGKVHIPKKHTI